VWRRWLRKEKKNPSSLDSRHIRTSYGYSAFVLMWCPVHNYEGIHVKSSFQQQRSCPALTVLLISCLAGSLSAAPTQSPIDIRSENTVFATLPALNFLYGSAVPLDVINNGSPDEEATIRANVAAGAGSLSVAGTTYDLTQFHFHTESEHLVNGSPAEMEMHMVHQSATGELLVVGRFIELGLANVLLDVIFSNLPQNPGDSLPIGSFDLAGLLPADLRSFRYTGSLTTPPFTEGVNWILLAEPLEFSSAQIDAFRDLFPDGNERPPQDLNGRTIVTDVAGFSSVPEPGTFVLFSVGGLVILARRIRSARS
jgi:carbonic anhydrase